MSVSEEYTDKESGYRWRSAYGNPPKNTGSYPVQFSGVGMFAMFDKESEKWTYSGKQNQRRVKTLWGSDICFVSMPCILEISPEFWLDTSERIDNPEITK